MVSKKISKKPRRKNSWLTRFLTRRTESAKPAAAHPDKPDDPPLKKGEVVELNSENYDNFISADKDVIVEFYHHRNPACTAVHKICEVLGQGYQNSGERIAIARYKVDNADYLPTNVYCLPTIKLYPAYDKDLPVEYFPEDYSDVDGYKQFIEDDAYYGKDLRWEPPAAPVPTLSVA